MATRKTAVPSAEGDDSKEPKIDRIRIQRIKVERIIVPVIGLTPLISHRFDEKARKQMLEKQTAAKRLREVKDPVAEYEASLYRIDLGQLAEAEEATGSKPRTRAQRKELDGQTGYGFPASAFRKATIGAARFYGKDVSMTGLRQMFMVKGILTKADPLALVQINGEPTMREDTVRLPNGNADVRFRAMFEDWSATLEFEYVASSIDDESLLSLVAAGGQFVGVGDWRPEKVGQFGTYEIQGDQIQRVRL